MNSKQSRDDLLEVLKSLRLPVYNESWTLDGDWMIGGDWHAPFVDLDMLQRLVKVGRRLKIRQLLIAGDLYDMANFSKYDQVVQAPSWATERDSARYTLKYLLSWFSVVRIIMGNHDRRIQKFTAGAFEVADILSLLTTSDKARISDYGYCVIINPNGGPDWRISHPLNYSINQLTIADALAQKHQQNVMTFHEHHCAVGFDRYKRYVIINGGCMADHQKFAYVQLDDNKSAGMKKGFVALKNGYATLYADGITDWSNYD